MRTALLLLTAGWMTLGYAEESCRREERGQLRPAGVESDAALRRQARECGELRMCTVNVWGQLRWMAVSTPYWRLAKKPAPAACAASLPGAAPGAAAHPGL
jgi:hypothetical protein